jgi:hypothetical protein
MNTYIGLDIANIVLVLLSRLFRKDISKGALTGSKASNLVDGIIASIIYCSGLIGLSYLCFFQTFMYLNQKDFM